MPSESRPKARSRRTLVCVVLMILILAFVGLAVNLHYRSSGGESDKFTETFNTWATALDEAQCASISKDIYAIGGTVADATVASLLCLGVVLPESLGIGGGFLALYFDRKSNTVKFLNARESAPSAAKADMFAGKGVKSISGARAIAVPGELRGYRELLRVVGSNVSQAELFKPAIKLARDGFRAGEHLAEAMRSKRELIYADKGLRHVYFNPNTNNTWEQGDTIYNRDLADTLEQLANSTDFAQEFYTGSLGNQIVQEVTRLGGILKQRDLYDYGAEWANPTHWKMRDVYDVYSANLPGSGPVLGFMFNVLDAYNISNFENDSRSYQRLTEIFKHAYAQRSFLGDRRYTDVDERVEKLSSGEFAREIKNKINDSRTLPIEAYQAAMNEPKDRGTSHANFFAPDGDVISITSTVNFYFGSGVQIRGIVLNNEMDDFSTPDKSNGFGLPPSKSNFISPGKRPMSSMVPTIVIKDGNAKMAIGGAGGSQITSATALVLFRYFYMGVPLKNAISDKRLHHQLIPNEILYESGFDEEIINELKRFGHSVRMKPKSQRGSVILGIVREGDALLAYVDPRKGGRVVGGSRKDS